MGFLSPSDNTLQNIQSARKIAQQVLDNMYYRWEGVGANENLIAEALVQNPTTFLPSARLPDIHKVIDGISHQFVLSPRWTAAFTALYSVNADAWGLRLDANEIAFEKFYRERFPFDTSIDAGRLISLLTYPDFVRTLVPNAAWEGAQAAKRQKTESIRASVADSGRKISDLTRRFYDENGEIIGHNPHDKLRNQAAADSEQARLLALSPEQLNSEFTSWTENNRLRGLSRDEAHAEVKFSESQRLATYARFETLPDLYTPIGKTEGVEWTERMLRSLPSTELARLMRIYGDQQLTSAIQNSASQGRY